MSGRVFCWRCGEEQRADRPPFWHSDNDGGDYCQSCRSHKETIALLRSISVQLDSVIEALVKLSLHE